MSHYAWVRNLCPLSYSIGRMSMSVGLAGVLYDHVGDGFVRLFLCHIAGGRACVDRRQRQGLGWVPNSVAGVERLFKS